MKGTYQKEDLLRTIRANRETHREVFDAALNGYRQQAMKILEDTLQDISKGRTPELRIILSRPEDRTRDYDRIIRMLEMEVAETIELSEEQFAQYVMDDWAWKRTWLRMSNTYAAGATERAYGVVEDE